MISVVSLSFEFSFCFCCIETISRDQTFRKRYYSPERSIKSVSVCRVAKKSMASSVILNREPPTSTTMNQLGNPYRIVRHLASSNAVVLFSISGCCMCTVAKRLLFGLGAGPTIVELDHHSAGPDIQAVLFQLASEGKQAVPAVFVGGKFLGGIETLMACHINGTLVPLLKDAGALWL